MERGEISQSRFRYAHSVLTDTLTDTATDMRVWVELAYIDCLCFITEQGQALAPFYAAFANEAVADGEDVPVRCSNMTVHEYDVLYRLFVNFLLTGLR